jgi:hypothetical protein
MPEQDYDKDFPNLRTLGFVRTSEPADYNCIAFAVGDLERWWWPSGREDEYWPLPIPEKATLSTFIDAFATAGFTPCANGDPETGLQKIALFGLQDRRITHAARLQDGKIRWQSKLGPHEDIEHTLEGLKGPCYGAVIAYFSKRANT